jgi:plasmid stabilization system protein ParE
VRLKWSHPALSDLTRLRVFLEDVNPKAAARAVHSLRAGARKLQQYPRLGESVEHVEQRDVRRVMIDDYELRYEVDVETVHILRIWHHRGNR